MRVEVRFCGAAARAVRFGLMASLIAAGCGPLYSESPRYGRGAARRPPALPPREAPADNTQGMGTLPWPAQGEVVGTFGSKSDPKYGTRTVNRGIDIRTVRGAAVTAVDSGVVGFADRFMGYGNTVIIEHGGRRHSVYSGLAEIGVRLGERVGRGQRIGASGDTLHLEFRVGGKSVDPMLWLTRR